MKKINQNDEPNRSEDTQIELDLGEELESEILRISQEHEREPNELLRAALEAGLAILISGVSREDRTQ